jgi:hypothetical protein
MAADFDPAANGGSILPSAFVSMATMLARQTASNTIQLCWCRLRVKSMKFPLSKYPEVVPKSRCSVTPASIFNMNLVIE